LGNKKEKKSEPTIEDHSGAGVEIINKE